MKNNSLYSYFIVTVGSILFGAAVNLFIVPYELYNGGIIGLAQVIRTILVQYLHIDINFDIAGIINFFLNLPLLIMAFKNLKTSFVKKTIWSIFVQTITMSIIPVMQTPIVQDRLASIIVGAIASAIGCSMILVQKGSAGGTDILGMLFAIKMPKMSVGKVGLYFNFVLYSICAVLFNIEIAIYSILQVAIFSAVVDRMHLQNIEVSVMIFTKCSDVKDMIIKEQHRGVTYWKGIGAYTNQDTEVLVSIVSKYEIPELRKKIKELDPQAFIVISSQLEVSGGFEKRLV